MCTVGNAKPWCYKNYLLHLCFPAQIQTTYNPFEPRITVASLTGTAADSDVAAVVCGKEFGLVRSVTGRMYFYGKAGALGLKAIGKAITLKPTCIVVSKSTNIVHMAVGHDGIHAVLLGEDGSAFFAGTARRGEDGDSSKNRRQPKACKPKRLAKMESHCSVDAACNNGTSAFVTKTGKLVMFGKDTAHCDANGLVTALVDQQIVRVALGKAHCVALNAKGQVFTFGLNNKGQCGRAPPPPLMHVLNRGKSDVPMEATSASAVPAGSSASATSGGVQATPSPHRRADGKCKLAELPPMCDVDEHHIDQGQCRVCPFCRECTGYNTSCVVSQMIDLVNRVPGANCACGRGEAGCVRCGACATCVAVQENETGGELPAGECFLVVKNRT